MFLITDETLDCPGRSDVTSDLQIQLPLCCPCGSGDLYRRGLCEACYNRGRRSRARFGGKQERILDLRETRWAEQNPKKPASCSPRPHAAAGDGREGKCDLRAGPGLAGQPLVELVLNGLPSERSRRAYGRALGDFLVRYPPNASGEGFIQEALYEGGTVRRHSVHHFDLGRYSGISSALTHSPKDHSMASGSMEASLRNPHFTHT